MRKKIIAGIIAVVIAALGFFVYRMVKSQNRQQIQSVENVVSQQEKKIEETTGNIEKAKTNEGEELSQEVGINQVEMEVNPDIEEIDDMPSDVTSSTKPEDENVSAELTGEQESTETGNINNLIKEATEIINRDEPVLYMTVNGQEIWSNNEDLTGIIRYYEGVYKEYGYDTDDETFKICILEDGIDWLKNAILYRQIAKEMNYPDPTEEKMIEYESEAKDAWESIISDYRAELGEFNEETMELASIEDTEKYLEETYGFTEEKYISSYVRDAILYDLVDYVQNKYSEGIEVTEKEVRKYFDELVERDKEKYEGHIPVFELNTQYYGEPSYYIPEGYRGITHILLQPDDNLLEQYLALKAEYDGDEESNQEESEIAEGSKKSEAITKPAVTKKLVETARTAVIESVRPALNEIMEKIASGVAFSELIAEYGTDPDMDGGDNNSYLIHKDSTLIDGEYKQTALELKQIGDVSEPLVYSNGVYILCYQKDITPGAVEYTEEVENMLTDELKNERKEEIVSIQQEEMNENAEVVYTEDGLTIHNAAMAIYDGVGEEDVETELTSTQNK